MKFFLLEYKRLYCDIRSIKNNTIGFSFLILFRLSKLIYLLNIPILKSLANFLYKILSRVFYSCDIPLSVNIQSQVYFYHLIGVVIHADTRILRYTKIRQCTTIGKNYKTFMPITISRNIDIGANVVIVGDKNLKPNSRIKACSLVI